MSKIIHLSVDVRGLLLWPDRELRGALRWIKRDDGSRFSGVGALKLALMDALAGGYEYLPTGPCDRHDPKKGCLGHESVEVAFDADGGTDA